MVEGSRRGSGPAGGSHCQAGQLRYRDGSHGKVARPARAKFKSCHPDSKNRPLTCRHAGQGPSSCSDRATYVQRRSAIWALQTAAADYWVTFWVPGDHQSGPALRARDGPGPRFRSSGPLSVVSRQCAPGGIRTPNLLIRSNSIDPTPTEAARPETKPGQTFAQVTGVRRGRGGPGRGVTELRSRGLLGHILGHRGQRR